MDKNDAGKVEALISDMEDHFGKKLNDRMKRVFILYVMENFSEFSGFEKACELIAISEVTYGRFPPFARFADLYREWRLNNEGAYAQPQLPAAWVSDLQSGGDFERLKAKAAVAGFLNRRDFYDDAIAEAEQRGMNSDDLADIEFAFFDATKKREHFLDVENARFSRVA